jgi:hypothetical protein
MKLEQQVCSLQIAQKLKELGVKQESLFGHYRHADHGKLVADIWHIDKRDKAYLLDCSAFTAAELGEMLPYKIGKKRFDQFTLRMWNECPGVSLLSYEKPVYDVSGGVGTSYLGSVDATTEADARAKMLIYLIENCLVKF